MHQLRIHKAEALIEQDGYCAYCKVPITLEEATADHRWPKAQRGTADRKNIAAVCQRCNSTKGSMSDIELYKLLKRGRPPAGASPDILLIWASRRIWKRTKRAIERIERLAR